MQQMRELGDGRSKPDGLPGSEAESGGATAGSMECKQHSDPGVVSGSFNPVVVGPSEMGLAEFVASLTLAEAFTVSDLERMMKFMEDSMMKPISDPECKWLLIPFERMPEYDSDFKDDAKAGRRPKARGVPYRPQLHGRRKRDAPPDRGLSR